MKHLRVCFVIVITAALAVAVGAQALATLQQQRGQISVSIQVNVTPAVAFRDPGPVPIDWRIAMRARGSAPADFVAQAQSAVRVQAVVTPNPNATLLYYNFPSYVINQTAGTTASYTCAYTITVDKVGVSWNLYDGLSNDFTSTFPGKDLANNTYVQGGTPQPTATPFIVYPDNNSNWYKRVTANAAHTYCVTLTLTIPSSVPGGAYTTNAVYTLYY